MHEVNVGPTIPKEWQEYKSTLAREVYMKQKKIMKT